MRLNDNDIYIDGVPMDFFSRGREQAKELAIIRAFVQRVNARAEKNMLKTGKLEGSHYAAMQTELDWLEQRDMGGYEHETLYTEMARLEMQVEQIRAALRKVEWIYTESDCSYCPWCDNIKEDGHDADCQRQVALGEEDK